MEEKVKAFLELATQKKPLIYLLLPSSSSVKIDGTGALYTGWF